MRNQAEPLASFIPEHTTIPHHLLENSEPKSIVRYGFYLLRNRNLFAYSLYVYLSPFQMKSIVRKQVASREFYQANCGMKGF